MGGCGPVHGERMLIDELEKNRRGWEEVADSLAQIAERCLRGGGTEWASTSADRFRDELADRVTELHRLRELALAVVDAYARHIPAVQDAELPADALLL